MDSDNLISASEMIMTTFTNIERAQIEKNNNLLKTWRAILESIRSNVKNGENLGANLYAHSRVIDLKNGILLIETDHPGWIQTFRFYQKYILTGLKRKVPELEISSLAFRLRGTNVELHSQISEEKIRNNIEERIRSEEHVIQNFDKNRKKNSSFSEELNIIPENLQKILDKLKNDILTDSK